jgi:outer membrane protein
METKMPLWRRPVTILILMLSVGTAAAGQDRQKPEVPQEATRFDYSTSHAFPNIFSAYAGPFVPKPRLDNSHRLENLISDGKLALSLDDAIALALENNLDIAVARYDLPIAQTDYLRAKGGGAARGAAGASVSNTIFSGGLGTGVGGGGVGGGRGAGGILGGGINGVSSAACCDPNFYISYGWSNAVTPLNYTAVSGVPVEATHQAYVSAGYSQGFLTGTSFSASQYSSRLSSNTTTGLFNPEFVSGFSVGIAQHLLNGFGARANGSFIRIARNDLKYSMSVFRQSASTTVAAVMTSYFDLLADQESIRVAEEGLQNARKLLESNQAQLKIGAVAQYDVLRSREEAALRQQDLLVAGNTFAQDAQTLKAKISRSFNGGLAMVQILPTDRLPEPHPDDIPPLDEALRQAASHRPEIEQAELNLQNQAATIRANRNRLLPELDVFVSYDFSGLGAALRPTLVNILNNDYPNLSYGVSLSLPIRNRTAQADAARALLEQRQWQMKLQNARNQAVWDVSKAVSAVQQAKSQLDAAVNLAALSRQVLDMQQQKFKLASATVEEVITAQGNLDTAEGNVVKARATYAKALIQYEQATGTLLERNNIELSEAVQGEVHRAPNIPGTRQPLN